MPILSAFENRNERIAITDIGIEAPLQKTDYFFNPETDISEETWLIWQGMLSSNDYAVKPAFLEIGAFTTILNRERIQPHLKMRKDLVELLSSKKDLVNLDDLYDLAMVCLLYPDLNASILQKNLEMLNHIDKIVTELNQISRYLLPTYAYYLVINRRLPSMPGDVHRRTDASLLIYKERKDYLEYLEAKAWQRIVFPDRFKPLTQDDRGAIRQAVQEFFESGRKEAGLQPTQEQIKRALVAPYMRLAMNYTFMAILSADDVVVNEKGIKLIFTQNRDEEIEQSPPPAQRSF